MIVDLVNHRALFYEETGEINGDITFISKIELFPGEIRGDFTVM